MRDLLAAARAYYIESDSAVAEVERILSLDEEDVGEVVTETAQAAPETIHV
jgi:phosphate:Na+ symporter